MKILVISGSGNREGMTARAFNAICQGVTDAGGTTEVLFLTELKIKLCQQCDADGWGQCRHEGTCVLTDDFAAVCDKIDASDVIVFANPVYFGDLSESMKAFLDRYRRTIFWKMMSAGPGRGLTTAEPGPPAIALCYAGGSGNGTTSCCANMERILQTCGFDVIDMIPARRQNLEAKLPMLELTGKWLAAKPTSGPPFRPPAPEKK
ncbi:MAG: flavodoxin family protein [Dehalococcoidales bacterium]|nr:flavodoxin family protein [Dehalococcoidales bacterium]